VRAIRILIADDHPSIRDAMKRLLCSRQHIVIVAEASDGEQAVSLALEHRPDLIVMDVSMPQLDGFEATRRIAVDAPGVAVLVVTAFVDDDFMHAALRAGAVGFLAKTRLAEDLLPAVEAVARGDGFVPAGLTPAD
jgi:DNA-binding NarL/FixJ family response regulator